MGTSVASLGKLVKVLQKSIHSDTIDIQTIKKLELDRPVLSILANIIEMKGGEDKATPYIVLEEMFKNHKVVVDTLMSQDRDNGTTEERQLSAMLTSIELPKKKEAPEKVVEMPVKPPQLDREIVGIIRKFELKPLKLSHKGSFPSKKNTKSLTVNHTFEKDDVRAALMEKVSTMNDIDARVMLNVMNKLY